MESTPIASLGALYLGDNRCRFQVWAPLAAKLEVQLVAPQERLLALAKGGRGYHQAILEEVSPGSRYFYKIDGNRARPDPASRCQPEGVHGPSQVTSTAFPWEDSGWFGLALQHYIIYELHVGTFTTAGTFDAIIPYLDELKELGVSALELMPVAQFPGSRNWGYDGVYPYAVQNSYGGPEALKRLVNACHLREMAVILDVVYNHLGPEGNYLWDFGPYFTERYRTPWGPAINFDGAGSDEVRRFFLENALYWITEFHLDALRLDALHAVFDQSAKPFLQELAEAVHEQAERLNRRVYLMAESDLNDTRLLRSPELGGFGLAVHWNDDFHHALHTLLTAETGGYYQDFGSIQHLVKAFKEGFVYSGNYSAYRGRRHGSSSLLIPAHRFIVFVQNHDQVGNRILGERLSRLVSLEALKLAAGVVLLSPFLPLLFMGEEYGETAPFQYFVSYADPVLVEAVRRGRREEYAPFQEGVEPPDPQAEETFITSQLNQHLRREGLHKIMLAFYRELIRLRREIPALACLSKDRMEVQGDDSKKIMLLRRWHGESEAMAIFHFGQAEATVSLPLPPGRWGKRLDSAAARWHGPGSSLPESLLSDGAVSVSLPPLAGILLVKEKEA
jgi:maltooligosyltrehalose trehalohydrolase